jgi:hypothetical protein
LAKSTLEVEEDFSFISTTVYMINISNDLVKRQNATILHKMPQSYRTVF